MQDNGLPHSQLIQPSGSQTPTPRISTDSTSAHTDVTDDTVYSVEDRTDHRHLPPVSERNQHRLKPSRNFRQLSISPSPHRSAPSPDPTPPASKSDKVTWRSLPHKTQLFILFLARLSEPLANTSLQSYLYYQLASFDRSLPPSKIAAQAGVVSAAFSAAQTLTSIFWGSVADATWGGRKLVIVIGLCGTGIGCLGYGFAQTWWSAVFWRLLSGALNGNVGVMRTMISEIVKEKKYQSRAFLLLPLCFNIGVIIGPVLGGILADPAGSYPGLFGPGGTFGGKDGVWWMKKWPYSPPNILSAMYLFLTTLMVFFFLKETHEALQDKPGIGIRIGHSVIRLAKRLAGRSTHDYSSLPADDIRTPIGPEETPLPTDDSIEMAPATPLSTPKPKPRYVLPLRRLFTRNVLTLLTSHFLMAMGVGTYNSLWFVFLSTPRFDPAHPIPPSHKAQHPPFKFTGGLGLPPTSVGIATAIIGVIGITLQLTLYPSVSARLGTLLSYQLALCVFPVVYSITPYLSLAPSTSEPPKPMAGFSFWMAIAGVLSLQVLARTFALPAQVILINNSPPHPSRLGTLHGVAQSVSSAARTLGPMGWAWVMGRGLSIGVVGLAYWGMAVCAVVGAVVGSRAREGEEVKEGES